MSLNPYQYAYANPVLHTDPSGQIVPICQLGKTMDLATGQCILDPNIPAWLRDLPQIPGIGIALQPPGGVTWQEALARLGIGICAYTLYKILSQAQVQPQAIPETAPEPTPSTGNRMRVQLQKGFKLTYSIPVEESVFNGGKGVTVRQVRDAMSGLNSAASTGLIDWFPYTSLGGWLYNSIIELSKELTRFPPGGYSLGGHVPGLTRQTQDGLYRIDIVNDYGWNLRYEDSP